MRDFDNLLDTFNADTRLVINYFVVFSRFEFALKAAGFATGNDRAEVDWAGFAHALGDYFDFERTEEVKQAVEFIENDPPKQLVRHDAGLVWVDYPYPNGKPRLRALLLNICMIRNNLFHGGKFQTGIDATPERNTDLLYSALVILDECLTVSEQHAGPVTLLFFSQQP